MAGGRQPGGVSHRHRADAEAAAGAGLQDQPELHSPHRGEDPDQAGAGESEVHGGFEVSDKFNIYSKA